MHVLRRLQMVDTIEPLYQSYCNYTRGIVQVKDLSSFKRNPAYTGMLEHVSPELGDKYFKSIVSLHGLEVSDILAFCKKNDRIGSPLLTSIRGMSVSPSSLRYIQHALLILKHCVRIGNLTPSIVEVGCGYGGLALAIDHFSPMFDILVKKYTMIDLDAPLGLQKLYLSNHTMSFPVYFESASTYGSAVTGNDNFLVSNYCFSEVCSSVQENYLKTLFPKCSNGFLLWNNVKIFDIGKAIQVEPEDPLTCPTDAQHLNYHVYF
jgi:hypothetical protein